MQRDIKQFTDIPSEFVGLVEAPLDHAQVMQGYGYQYIGVVAWLCTHMLAQEMTQNPAGCVLMFELEQLYQPVSGKFIMQWAKGAGERWWVLYAKPTDIVLGGTQRQTTLAAIYTCPWQLGFARLANANCAASLTTKDTTWR